MYRIWYSTESFADFIIDKTLLAKKDVIKKKMYESDANNPNNFHKMPDHIRKILYLDAPDLIVEKDDEPVFSIEVTTEAGTGHNVFQRFARLAASVENNVPTIYIYPEAKIISRTKASEKWDMINPLIFNALESVMSVYNIPALLYYFPTDDINKYRDNVKSAPHIKSRGLCFDSNIIKYTGCPDSSADSMINMFEALNEIIEETEKKGVIAARKDLLKKLVIRKQRRFMNKEYNKKTESKLLENMSPMSAVVEIPTLYLLNYLSKYETNGYKIGELLRNREISCLYQVNAAFRGDPYPGCLSAIDYMVCREGMTYEDRKKNLIMVWGLINVDEKNQTISITNDKNSSIKDFFSAVQSSSRLNLLTKNYNDLKSKDIPRYFMQARYGSTYSKVKHIRVYSYFADAILFPDGSLWRDA